MIDVLDGVEGQPPQIRGPSGLPASMRQAVRVLVRHHGKEEHGKRQQKILHVGGSPWNESKCNRKLTAPRNSVKGASA